MDEFKIKKTPTALQPFIIRGVNNICTFDVYLDASNGPLLRQGSVTPNQTNSFRCSLQNIERVRYTTLPFGNAYPCLVLGQQQFPRVGDGANVHLFPPINVQGFNLTTLGVDKTYPFVALAADMEINSDYRYFTPYIYVPTSGAGGNGLPIGGTSSAQGGTYVSTIASFFITFSGPQY